MFETARCSWTMLEDGERVEEHKPGVVRSLCFRELTIALIQLKFNLEKC